MMAQYSKIKKKCECWSTLPVPSSSWMRRVLHVVVVCYDMTATYACSSYTEAKSRGGFLFPRSSDDGCDG